MEEQTLLTTTTNHFHKLQPFTPALGFLAETWKLSGQSLVLLGRKGPFFIAAETCSLHHGGAHHMPQKHLSLRAKEKEHLPQRTLIM